MTTPHPDDPPIPPVELTAEQLADWAPAAGSSARAAWDALDVAGRRIVVAWLEDYPEAAEALEAHPQRQTVLAALGYSRREIVA